MIEAVYVNVFFERDLTESHGFLVRAVGAKSKHTHVNTNSHRANPNDR